ncbi:MAG: MauE/DoxX family redox-associated membrane protein [Bryobacteraceae bacterium]
MRYFLIALRSALAAVFLYAAYMKLREPWLLFAMSIDAYQILPEWAALTLGRILPWLELFLGLLLLTGFGLRYSAAGASILLGGFFAVMVRAYVMGMKIDCACFGLGDVIGPRTLARDGVLLALSVGLTALATVSKKRMMLSAR